MSAIELLESQHREVEGLLGRAKQSNGGERVRLLGQIAEALSLHTTLEERFFYPALREYGLGELVDVSVREHDEARRLVSEIMDLKSRDPRLVDLVNQLEASVAAHVRKEEAEVFPRAREKMEASALEHAGNAMRNAMEPPPEQEVTVGAEEGQPPAP